MFDLTNFTPWTLFSDAGIIFGLLLIGKLCRAKVKAIQSLFIPPSLIAGVLALAFGPNGLQWLPLTNNLGTYSSILIAVVFAALPLAAPPVKMKEIGGKLGPMWAYSQFGMFFQWALIGLIGIVFLTPVFNVAEPFGIMCPVGFYGGHGTAAAMAAEFGEGFPEPDALSLGMTSATVGVILGVIFGVMFIKLATKKHQTNYVTDFAELPKELRSGLIPEEKRDSLGNATVSSISIDNLALHLGIVILAAFGGYVISTAVKTQWDISVPVFLSAYIVGLLLKLALDATKASYYLEQKTISNVNGTATDLLVACGVGAINLKVVTDNWLPLVVLIFIGIAVTVFMVFFFARHLYKEDWFEKAIFAWGWWTGTMAIGIALLRIVDPKNESHALDNYALAFLPCAPVEIILIASIPIAFKGGWLLWLCVGYLVLSLLILLLAKMLGWWIPSKALKGGDVLSE